LNGRKSSDLRVLGLGSFDEIDFDEDDLYAVLDDLAERRFALNWIVQDGANVLAAFSL